MTSVESKPAARILKKLVTSNRSTSKKFVLFSRCLKGVYAFMDVGAIVAKPVARVKLTVIRQWAEDPGVLQQRLRPGE
jgi:hypothetical protein